jgi:tol-pal system protein YbgF
VRGLSWFQEESNVIKVSGAGFILMLLLLGGCAPTPQQLRVERDLEEMKRRLAETERTLASQRETIEGSSRDRFDAMGHRQADLQVGLEGIRVELQAINGRIADGAARSRELHDTVSLVQEDLSLKVSALEGRIAELEKRPLAAPSPPPPAAEPNLSATARYEKGVALVQKKGSGKEGRKILEDFLHEHPKNDLVPNALYWIGEAYYGEQEYESAILQFQDVIQKHAKHQKVPASMLKQGMAFNALKDRKSARAILRRLTEEFPKSDEAKKAKELLKSWSK